MLYIKLKIGSSYKTNPDDELCEQGIVDILDENDNPTEFVAIRKHHIYNIERLNEILKNKKIIGLSSYTNFPQRTVNSYETKENIMDQISDKVILWLHCFKDPQNYIPFNIPLLLHSETDQYNIRPCHDNACNEKIKEYDFCCYLPISGVNEKWCCWVRGVDEAVRWLNYMADEMKLKILVVGSILYKGFSDKIHTIGFFIQPDEWFEKLGKCKYFINFSRYDASPRIIMDSLMSNIPILLNENILGGWKYINKDTGMLFFHDADIKDTITTFMEKTYNPRNWINNYHNVEKNQILLADTVNRITSFKYEDIIDGIMFINLENRIDRFNEITNEFVKQGIPDHLIHRIDAILDITCGHLGCSKSHVKAMEYAKSKNWKRFIIFEDDFIFNLTRERVLFILKEFLLKYQDNWDVFLIGLNPFHYSKDTDINFIKQITQASTASGYMVNMNYYDKLYDNFTQGLNLCQNEIDSFKLTNPNERKYNTNFPVDQYWFRLQGRDRWFTSEGCIGKQSGNRSSIMTNI